MIKIRVMKRRTFIQNASLTGIGVVAGAAAISCKDEKDSTKQASSTSNSMINSILPVVKAPLEMIAICYFWRHPHL